MNSLIKDIIDAANQAPSGGNSQPWRFEVEENRLRIIALPERDHKVMNFRGRATMVAHGAQLEIVSIFSSAHGYRADIQTELSPSPISTITFTNSDIDTAAVELARIIFQRHSNRKPYATDTLSPDDHGFIFAEGERYPDCRMRIAEGENLKSVAEGLSVDSRLTFENKILHRMFYREIVWTREEESQRGGLYLPTMELDEKKSKPVKMLANRPLAALLKIFGLFKKIHRMNADKATLSSAIVALAVPDSDESFVHAGRILMNIWLRAVQRGYAIQIMAGMPFLWQHLHSGERSVFSAKEARILDEHYERLRKGFDLAPNERVGMSFRIGKPLGEPLAVSRKRPPEVREG